MLSSQTKKREIGVKRGRRISEVASTLYQQTLSTYTPYEYNSSRRVCRHSGDSLLSTLTLRRYLKVKYVVTVTVTDGAEKITLTADWQQRPLTCFATGT